MYSKSAYQNDFWKIMWHWRLKIQLCITEINDILKYIQIENTLNWNNISQYYCFYCGFDQTIAVLVSMGDFKIYFTFLFFQIYDKNCIFLIEKKKYVYTDMQNILFDGLSVCFGTEYLL